MLDFDKIINLRDRLIVSLEHWQSPADGFFRSAPIVGPDSPPSFTNTGIVLQAYNESGKTHLAQKLADRLIEYLQKRDYSPFPHEKAEKGEPKGHILCNSWPIFAILDCYPIRVTQFEKVCDWFLTTQKEDGSWDLLPGEETRYPIFSAYALSALLQFYDCYQKLGISNPDIQKKLLGALHDGFDFLFKNRAQTALTHDLLLWPASLIDIDKNPVSFSTSVICMHMIAKASKLLDRYDWPSKIENTFAIIVDSVNREKGEERFVIEQMKVNIWDQVHVNESSLNYFYAFFSPTNLVTLLRYSSSPKFSNNPNYYDFVSYLTQWILDNASDVAGFPGIKGGQYIADVKIWSTAQAVIVLSRILNRGYELAHLANRFGRLETDYSQLNIRYGELEQKYNQLQSNFEDVQNTLDKIKNTVSDITIASLYKKIATGILNVIVVLVGLGIFLKYNEKVQTEWTQIQGKIWLLGTLVSTIAILVGINISKYRSKCINYVYRLLMWPIQGRKLERILREMKETDNSKSS